MTKPNVSYQFDGRYNTPMKGVTVTQVRYKDNIARNKSSGDKVTSMWRWHKTWYSSELSTYIQAYPGWI